MARAFETVIPAEGARPREAGARVYDVRGGLSAWRRDGLPFEA